MPTKTSSEKKTILVVEDEDSLRLAMSLVFRASGYKVLQAASGQEAYQIVENEKLDIIISDVRMPNGDGIGLLQKVRARHVERPVLFLVTGHTDLKIEEAYDMGADAVFAKPFDRNLLLETIAEKLLDPAERWSQTLGELVARELQVHIKIGSLQELKVGPLLKIGRGGFFVTMSENLPRIDQMVDFNIESLNTPFEALRGQGTVRWVRHQASEALPQGCGIEFKNIEAGSIEKLLTLIAADPIKALIPKGF